MHGVFTTGVSFVLSMLMWVGSGRGRGRSSNGRDLESVTVLTSSVSFSRPDLMEFRSSLSFDEGLSTSGESCCQFH